MVLLLVAGPGPGDHPVPAPDDVHDGGQARGHADAAAQGQQVAVSPERETQNVSDTIHKKGNQIETLKMYSNYTSVCMYCADF